MDNIPIIIHAVGGLTPEQMLFVVAVVALSVVAAVALAALKSGGSRDGKA